jgi:phytoene desaturase
MVSGRRARSVVTSHETLSADLVVANADYAHVETRLLDDGARSKSANWWNRRVWAPSMFILYLGLNRRLEKLTHHNLYFRENWNDHFDMIFKQPGWPQKPCFYVSCISKSDDDAAPAGGENVFVLVPVAAGMQDTDEQRQRYADHLISHIEQVSGEAIRSAIAVQRVYSQRDFINDYNAYRGTALGLSHTLGQTAIFRPPLQSRRVQNLFYTGQYTHPGVGVPMVLISAQVAAGLIQEAAA